MASNLDELFNFWGGLLASPYKASIAFFLDLFSLCFLRCPDIYFSKPHGLFLPTSVLQGSAFSGLVPFAIKWTLQGELFREYLVGYPKFRIHMNVKVWHCRCAVDIYYFDFREARIWARVSRKQKRWAKTKISLSDPWSFYLCIV